MLSFVAASALDAVLFLLPVAVLVARYVVFA